MLSEFNSFGRVKRRELKYSVNGVSRRISLTNNSPFKQSYFSLFIIKALPYCKSTNNASAVIEIIMRLRGSAVGVF